MTADCVWKKKLVVFHASNPAVPATIIAVNPEDHPDCLKLRFSERVLMPGNPHRGSHRTWVCSRLWTFLTTEEAQAVHIAYVKNRRSLELHLWEKPDVLEA